MNIAQKRFKPVNASSGGNVAAMAARVDKS